MSQLFVAARSAGQTRNSLKPCELIEDKLTEESNAIRLLRLRELNSQAAQVYENQKVQAAHRLSGRVEMGNAATVPQRPSAHSALKIPLRTLR